MSAGQLEIVILEAVFERDVKMFGTMDPKYMITWKETQLEGSAAEGGGQNPKWSEPKYLDIGYDYSSAGVITIVFTNEDDLIVQTEIDAVSICQNGQGQQWFDCFYEGENQGKCEIKTLFHNPQMMQQ